MTEATTLTFDHHDRVFVTSDHHAGHQRILELSSRPFTSLDEMHHAMIQRHNAVVPTDGLTIILGDLSTESQWQVGLEFARQLNGRLWLVPGNHDPVSATKRDFFRRMPAYQQVFEVIVEHFRMRLNGRAVHFSHYPYRGDHSAHDRFASVRLRDPGPQGDPIVNGHVHELWRILDNQINVGVDVRDFTPVPLTTIEAELTSIGFGPREGGDR